MLNHGQVTCHMSCDQKLKIEEVGKLVANLLCLDE